MSDYDLFWVGQVMDIDGSLLPLDKFKVKYDLLTSNNIDGTPVENPVPPKKSVVVNTKSPDSISDGISKALVTKIEKTYTLKEGNLVQVK